VVIGVAVIAAIIVAAMRDSAEPLQESAAPAPQAEAELRPVGSEARRLPVPEPAPPQGPVTDTVEGRTPYDTGIRNDPRVKTREDGKRVFIESVGIANEMKDPEASPEQAMERLGEVLSFYRMAFEENPVAADNQSVMASLMGENPRGLVFFPEDHPELNSERELLDPWGTPYYFHALSGKQMEIVSTGPDLKLGSDDDLIHTQRDEEDFFKGFTEPPPEVGEE